MVNINSLVDDKKSETFNPYDGDIPSEGWPGALTYAQAGRYIGLDERTIRDMVTKGQLQRVLIGPKEGSTRIRLQDLKAYLERQAAQQRS